MFSGLPVEKRRHLIGQPFRVICHLPSITTITNKPVESSHKTVTPSLPLDKTYLLFLENRTDETGWPLWADLNVLIHLLLTPSQTLE